ncbi:MAG: alpha/beta hydrolase [Hyphomonas sp.]|nr:MAG: alpha/beta hydrolase [Hyphomonas sp.]
MKVSDLHPQVQKQVARMPTISLRSPLSRMLMKSVMAIAFRSQADANVRRHTVKLEHVSVRVYEPVSEHAGAGMLFIHGGGYVMGQARMNDPDCNRIVSELGMSVVSVDYRLAPKHPYPAPLDDCYKAWLWFLDNAELLGVDPSRIAVAGQSAGGGLAAALCQRILDEGAPQPAAQLLYYPMIDDRTATRGDLTPVRHIAWNNENNFFGWSAYLGHPQDDGSEIPRWAVPSRRPDLSNLPPAWIGVGDKDLFYGENLDYAERLSKDGVESELEIVEDVPHGFDALAPEADISRDFREASFDFLRRRLGIDS